MNAVGPGECPNGRARRHGLPRNDPRPGRPLRPSICRKHPAGMSGSCGQTASRRGRHPDQRQVPLAVARGGRDRHSRTCLNTWRIPRSPRPAAARKSRRKALLPRASPALGHAARSGGRQARLLRDRESRNRAGRRTPPAQGTEQPLRRQPPPHEPPREDHGPVHVARPGPAFLPVHDQAAALSGPKRHGLSAKSDRHPRTDSFDLWNGCTAKLTA